jgi:hypothetical protein
MLGKTNLLATEVGEVDVGNLVWKPVIAHREATRARDGLFGDRQFSYARHD